MFCNFLLASLHSYHSLHYCLCADAVPFVFRLRVQSRIRLRIRLLTASGHNARNYKLLAVSYHVRLLFQSLIRFLAVSENAELC